MMFLSFYIFHERRERHQDTVYYSINPELLAPQRRNYAAAGGDVLRFRQRWTVEFYIGSRSSPITSHDPEAL